MNSPHVGMLDNSSPITEAENFQPDDVKQWNKSSVEKRASAPSPKLESAAPTGSPPPMQKHFCRQNGVYNRKKFKMDEEEYESLEMACNLAAEMNDDCEAFGKHVAAQLRLMNKLQKFMAQRLISEICFRGQIQHLSLSTNVVNTHQPQQQQQHQPVQQQPQQGPLQSTMFTTRPPVPVTIFNRTPDHVILHQQGLRPMNAIPLFQNFVPQQPEHSSVSLEQVG